MPASLPIGVEMFWRRQKRAVCDFCSAKPVVWSYPARDHSMGALVAVHPDPEVPIHVIHVESNGAWAACEPCRELIDRGARDALAERARRRMPWPQPETIEVDLLRLAHDEFWANREGAGRAVGLK